MKTFLQQASIAISVLALTGCSGMWNEASLEQEGGNAVARNQIVAWVPVDQAQTPTVVRARMLVALGKAKKTTERELCAGQWVFTGNVDESAPPQRGQAPQVLGAYAAWQYRIHWNPALPDCGNITSRDYFRTLSAHLPNWVVVQSGAEQTIYHQGMAVFTGEDQVLSRQLALQQHPEQPGV